MNLVQTQRCSKCNVVKPLSEFWRDKRKRNGKKSWCKPCELKAVADWRAANRAAHRARNFERHLMKTYDITVEQYELLLRRQKGVCAICGRPETAVYKRSKQLRRLCVDHCHKTKQVRGLLCRACNVGIGYLGDDASIYAKVARYLRKAQRARY